MAAFVDISADFSGQRVDNFLVRHIKNVPKTHIYKMLRKGEIRVNKGRVKPCYKLAEGDILRLPPEKTYQNANSVEKTAPVASRSLTQLTANIVKHAILFEDEQLLIINKPAGLAVHGGSGLSHGLIELLRLHYPKYLQLDLVHRLDRDTSGCIMVAKKHSMLRAMHMLLREGNVTKQYHALVQGGISSKQKVEVPLAKFTLSSGERFVRVAEKEGGQAALTRFTPIKAFSTAMLLKAVPVTGRTHQIRVHAQYIGCPIAGDEKYGDKEFNKSMKVYGVNRLFLHAHNLTFEHPKTKQYISVTAPYDECLTNALNTLN